MTANRKVANVGSIARSESGVSTSAIGLIMTCVIIIAMIPLYFNLSRASTDKESAMASLNMAVDNAQRNGLIQPMAGGLTAAPVANAAAVLQDTANELASNAGSINPMYIGIFYKSTPAVSTPMLARTSSGPTVLNAASIANINTAATGVTPGSYFLAAAELNNAGVVTASSKVAVAVANMDLAGGNSIFNVAALQGAGGNAMVARELGAANVRGNAGNPTGSIPTTGNPTGIVITVPGNSGGVIVGGGKGNPSGTLPGGENGGGTGIIITPPVDIGTGPETPIGNLTPGGTVIPATEIPTMEIPSTGGLNNGDISDGASLTTGEPGGTNGDGSSFSNSEGSGGIIDNSGELSIGGQGGSHH